MARCRHADAALTTSRRANDTGLGNALVTAIVPMVIVASVTLAVTAERPRILTLVVAPHRVLLVLHILVVDAAHAANSITNGHLTSTTAAETRLRLINLRILLALAIRVARIALAVSVLPIWIILSILAVRVKTRLLILVPSVGGPTGWIHAAGCRRGEGCDNLICFIGIVIFTTTNGE